jgi:DnaJ-class molecular chaperone
VRDERGGAMTCDECNGAGEVERWTGRSPSDFRMEPCEGCDGSGEVDDADEETTVHGGNPAATLRS